MSYIHHEGIVVDVDVVVDVCKRLDIVQVAWDREVGGSRELIFHPLAGSEHFLHVFYHRLAIVDAIAKRIVFCISKTLVGHSNLYCFLSQVFTRLR